MTRESLAKDILLAFIPRWSEIVEGMPPTGNTLKAVSANCVELADALLEALGTTEPPASWLSREMQTPAKGFPAFKVIEPGVSVIIRTKGTNQEMWDGLFGIVESRYYGMDLWWVTGIDGGPNISAAFHGKYLEIRG